MTLSAFPVEIPAAHRDQEQSVETLQQEQVSIINEKVKITDFYYNRLMDFLIEGPFIFTSQ